MKKQTQETEKIKRIHEILQAHRGKENPITSAQIAEMLDIHEDDTHAKTRALIKKSAKKFYLPLLSNSRGYYLAKNEDELNQYSENLKSRIAGIEERNEMVKNNFRRKES